MKRKDHRPINRRDFLKSSVTVVGGLPILSYASTRPCPPSSLSVSGGASTSTNCQDVPGQLPALMIVGATSSGNHPWTVGHGDNAAQLSIRFTGLGAAALQMSGYPGVVFDEINDRFLVFKSTNPIVTYAVNAENWEVSMLTTSSPPARINGIMNSVQFVPELKGVAIATTYHGNMHFMRVA